MNDQKQEGKEKQLLSRREALKALTAATGAVAISSLPKKWQTPVIEVGTLPAHAAASPLGPNVFNLTATYPPEDPTMTSIGAQQFRALAVGVNFDFEAPAGKATVQVSFAPTNSESITGSELKQTSGDEFEGHYWGGYWIEADCEDTVEVTVTITDLNGLTDTETAVVDFGAQCE